MYGVFILLINVIGMLVAYYYSGIIFGFTYGSLLAATVSGAAYGLFFVFVISILILLSSFVKILCFGGGYIINCIFNALSRLY